MINTRVPPRWIARAAAAAGSVLAATFGGFATVAILVLAQRAGAHIWVVNLAMLTPGVVTAILVPTSRRRWYRWVVILLLAEVVNTWATAPFLLVAVSWALWRSWFAERPARARKPGGAAHLPVMTKIRTAVTPTRTPKVAA